MWKMNIVVDKLSTRIDRMKTGIVTFNSDSNKPVEEYEMKVS